MKAGPLYTAVDFNGNETVGASASLVWVPVIGGFEVYIESWIRHRNDGENATCPRHADNPTEEGDGVGWVVDRERCRQSFKNT